MKRGVEEYERENVALSEETAEEPEELRGGKEAPEGPK